MARTKTKEVLHLEQENASLKEELDMLREQVQEFRASGTAPKKKMKPPGAAKIENGDPTAYRLDHERPRYSGGTLHNFNLGGWKAFGYTPEAIGNRLATVADYLALFMREPDVYLPSVNLLSNRDSNVLLLVYAAPIVNYIDSVARGHEGDHLAHMDVPTLVMTAAEILGFIAHNPAREKIDQKRSQKIAQEMVASPHVSQEIKDKLTGDSPILRGIRKTQAREDLPQYESESAQVEDAHSDS